MGPGALGKHSETELHPSPSFSFLVWEQVYSNIYWRDHTVEERGDIMKPIVSHIISLNDLKLISKIKDKYKIFSLLTLILKVQ